MARRAVLIPTAGLLAGLIGVALTKAEPRAPEVWGRLDSYAVVQSLDAPELTLVDIGRDRIAGVIDLPEIADQLAVSATVGRIVTANRARRQVLVYDLAAKAVEATLPLPFPPALLLVSPDGERIAAADPASGGVALISLRGNRLLATHTSVAGAANLSFSYNSQVLLAHDPAARRISVIDAQTGALRPAIELTHAPGPLLPASEAALTCLPGGLHCVAADARGRLSVIDMRAGTERQSLALGPAPARPYASLDGSLLLVPDTEEPRLTILSTRAFKTVATLSGASGLASVSTNLYDPAPDSAAPRRHRRARVGLRRSLKETAISVRRDGRRVWRGKCPSDPGAVASVLRRRAPGAKRASVRSGPVVGLVLPCPERRRAADDLHRRAACEGCARHGAEQDRCQGCRRSVPSGRDRVLPRGPRERVRQHADAHPGCGAQAPGPGFDRAFQPDPRPDEEVRPDRAKCQGRPVRDGSPATSCGTGQHRNVLRPLLEARIAVRGSAAELGRQLLRVARHSEACQRLMSVPGVGAITATSLATAIEDPENFRNSRSVAARIGLTTRRYQSGGSITTDTYRAAVTLICGACFIKPQPWC